MKNFLICILASLLMIGAFLSRPGEESYRSFIGQKAQGATYKDCWLWSTIEINGKVAYAGVFSRWFPVPEAGKN